MLQICFQSWKCDKKINFHYVWYPIFVKKYSLLYILRKLSNEISARLVSSRPVRAYGLEISRPGPARGPGRPVDISTSNIQQEMWIFE